MVSARACVVGVGVFAIAQTALYWYLLQDARLVSKSAQQPCRPHEGPAAAGLANRSQAAHPIASIGVPPGPGLANGESQAAHPIASIGVPPEPGLAHGESQAAHPIASTDVPPPKDNGPPAVERKQSGEEAKESEFWSKHDDQKQWKISWTAIKYFSNKIHEHSNLGATVQSQLGPKSSGERVGLTMGCGPMVGEYTMLRLFGVDRIDAYDTAEGMRDKFHQIHPNPEIPVTYYVSDVNKIQITPETYDIVYIQHAYHHFEALEHVAREIAKGLKPNGVVAITDWIGPNFLQRTPAQRAVNGNLWTHMPDKWRRDWAGNVHAVPYVSPKEALSPFEAVRGSEIKGVLDATFHIVHQFVYGGILYPLFEGFGHNYNQSDPVDMEWIRKMWDLDRVACETGAIEPMFMNAVYTKKQISAGRRLEDRHQTQQEAKESEFWSKHDDKKQWKISWTAINYFQAKLHELGDLGALVHAELGPKSNSERVGLTLGCGPMVGEYTMLHLFGVDRIDAYDTAEGMREKFHEMHPNVETPVTYYVSDVNKIQLTPETYDVVYIQHAYHHFEAIEHVGREITKALKPNGVFVIIDWIGPNFLQRTPAQQAVIGNLWRRMPSKWRRVHSGSVRDKPLVPRKESLSPFEAVRGSEIKAVLDNEFHTKFQIVYGGILYSLFEGFGHNYDQSNPEDIDWIHKMWTLDRLGAETGAIEPMFMNAIYTKRK